MAIRVPCVLVADDNPATRQIIDVALRGAGYVPILASSGQDAIDRFVETPDIDAVLADVVMPNMGGIELAQRVRLLRPDVPVLLMTGYGDYVEAVASIGAIPLIKPFTVSTLIRILQDCRDAADAASQS